MRLPPSPQPRNIAFEAVLCDAIGRRVMVELLCQGETAPCMVAPYVVFFTDYLAVRLSGLQVVDPTQPRQDDELLDVTVAEIISITATGIPSWIAPRFNPADARYAYGIICRVEGA